MTSESYQPFRCATLHVRGFNSRKKQYQVKRLLNEENIDILAVQETKMHEDDQIALALRPFLSAYEVCVSHAVGTSAGCFLFLAKRIALTDLKVTTDSGGRLIFCDFLLGGLQWRVLCIYAPNRICERESFFRQITEYVNCEKYMIF